MENKRKNRLLRVFFLLLMVVCLIPLVRAYCQSMQQKEQQEDLREMLTETSEEDLPAGELPEEDPTQKDSTPTGAAVILRKYKKLYKKNKDLAGWLSIKGMQIDNPVMQCEDDEYYLHRDFYGKKSKYGCLYVKNQADLDKGTNFIIYGHNMRDGSMFGDLDLYLDKKFYQKHPVISFDTLFEKRTYEIVAVFRSQVYRAEDEVFKYYQFYQADTKKEFNRFYKNIKKLSLYDTGVKARFGDTFLTLSTCAYHVQDGRLVVVAKRT